MEVGLVGKIEIEAAFPLYSECSYGMLSLWIVQGLHLTF